MFRRAYPSIFRAAAEALEQRMLLSVAPVGPEFRLNTVISQDQLIPVVASDATGDFVAAWQSQGQDGSGFGVYAQRFNAAGVAQGDEFRVNTFTTSDQSSPAIAMDFDGNFVVTWLSVGQDGSNNGIYAQRY